MNEITQQHLEAIRKQEGISDNDDYKTAQACTEVSKEWIIKALRWARLSGLKGNDIYHGWRSKEMFFTDEELANEFLKQSVSQK